MINIIRQINFKNDFFFFFFFQKKIWSPLKLFKMHISLGSYCTTRTHLTQVPKAHFKVNLKFLKKISSSKACTFPLMKVWLRKNKFSTILAEQFSTSHWTRSQKKKKQQLKVKYRKIRREFGVGLLTGYRLAEIEILSDRRTEKTWWHIGRFVCRVVSLVHVVLVVIVLFLRIQWLGSFGYSAVAVLQTVCENEQSTVSLYWCSQMHSFFFFVQGYSCRVYDFKELLWSCWVFLFYFILFFFFQECRMFTV